MKPIISSYLLFRLFRENSKSADGGFRKRGGRRFRTDNECDDDYVSD